MARRVLKIVVLLESQGGRIEAKAQAGGPRAVIENVSQVGVAPDAQDFRPIHAVAVVGVVDDILLGHRLKKAGPTGAGIKFRLRSEQGQSATDAIVNARFMLIVKGAAEGRFGAFVARDLILLLCQLFGPFRVRLDHFVSCDQRTGQSFIIEKANLHHSDLMVVGILAGSRRGFRLRAATRHPGGQRRRDHEFETDHHRVM